MKLCIRYNHKSSKKSTVIYPYLTFIGKVIQSCEFQKHLKLVLDSKSSVDMYLKEKIQLEIMLIILN